MGCLNDHDPANTHDTTWLHLGLALETQRFHTSHFPHPTLEPSRYGMIPGMYVKIPNKIPNLGVSFLRRLSM